MNRYMIFIIACIACILIPVFGVLYGIWDSYQPKIGPVGDGPANPTILQLIPICTTFLLGIINLPIAIMRYKKDKRAKKLSSSSTGVSDI